MIIVCMRVSGVHYVSSSLTIGVVGAVCVTFIIVTNIQLIARLVLVLVHHNDCHVVPVTTCIHSRDVVIGTCLCHCYVITALVCWIIILIDCNRLSLW